MTGRYKRTNVNATSSTCAHKSVAHLLNSDATQIPLFPVCRKYEKCSWRSSKSPSPMHDSAELVNWHSLLINMQQQLPLYRSSASAGLWDQLPCHLPNSTSTSKQSAEKSGKVTKPFAHPKIKSRAISKAAWASGYKGLEKTNSD